MQDLDLQWFGFRLSPQIMCIGLHKSTTQKSSLYFSRLLKTSDCQTVTESRHKGTTLNSSSASTCCRLYDKLYKIVSLQTPRFEVDRILYFFFYFKKVYFLRAPVIFCQSALFQIYIFLGFSNSGLSFATVAKDR